MGELPLSVQAKLLRVLQSGEIQRLGSDVTRQVDVRIVAATNRHLQAEDHLLPLKIQVDLCQRQAIQQALDRAEGCWSLAAKQLKVDSSNLHKLAKRLQLK